MSTNSGVQERGAEHSPFRARCAFNRASFTIGAESGGNVINVAIQLKDANGNDISERAHLDFYLSEDAEGDDITADAAGTIAIGTDGVYSASVAGIRGKLISEADGDIDINITKTGAKTYYLILCMPDGSLVASSAITFAA